MTERSYSTIDKTDWGDGPWQHEPDKLQWIDEATDLDCLIVRNHYGSLCGYVGVPPEHPLHGNAYDSVDVEVHGGGLTFANSCDDSAPSESVGICHIPAPGRPHDVWWFGFDCGHFRDLAPGMEARYRSSGWEPIASDFGAHMEYRDLPYVRDQCAQLAKQLAEAK